MRWMRVLSLVLIVLAGACSLRSAMQAMTSPEDRAFAQAMVDHLRRADSAWLEPQFDPQLWAQSGKRLGQVPAMFPTVPGTTEIVSFSTSTNMTNGRTERDKAFTLVTHGGGRWTVTQFRLHSTGGPERVVQWSVVPHDTAPPELTMMEAWDRALPWFWGGLLFVLAVSVGLIVWLVRRSRRRRRDPLEGGPPA